jgi:threonine dehydrogenase-like Zn-dependent dehydrogenase
MKAFSLKRGYIETDNPAPKVGHAIIRVDSCGLCGSDIRKFNAKNLPDGYLGTEILGHEISGTIEYANNVDRENYRTGDHIVVKPIISCGVCYNCADGAYQHCNSSRTIGKDVDGGFAQYVSVPIKNLKKINEDVRSEIATLADPLACAIHCLNSGDRKPRTEQKLAIVGDGTIALCCLYVAIKSRYKGIEIFGKHAENLEIAKMWGAETHRLEDETKTDYFDTVIEAVGRAQSDTLRQSIRMAKKRGSVVISGVFDHGYDGSIPVRDIGWKELSLIGSNSYCFNENRDEFDEAVELIENDHQNLKDLVTKLFPIRRLNEAVDLMMNKGNSGVVKIVIKPNV